MRTSREVHLQYFLLNCNNNVLWWLALKLYKLVTKDRWMKFYIKSKDKFIIIAFHYKYLKNYSLKNRFGNLFLSDVITEIGNAYGLEFEGSKEKPRKKGIKKIVKTAYEEHGIKLSNTEVKSLFRSFNRNNVHKILHGESNKNHLLKVPFLMCTILEVIIELSSNNNKVKEMVNSEIRKGEGKLELIPCYNIYLGGNVEIIDRMRIAIKQREFERSKEFPILKKLDDILNDLQGKFSSPCFN
jgi:hypothetical protein